jgi:hypothetical protein
MKLILQITAGILIAVFIINVVALGAMWAVLT